MARKHRGEETEEVVLVGKLEEATEAYSNAPNDTERKKAAVIMVKLLKKCKQLQQNNYHLEQLDQTNKRIIQEAGRIVKEQNQRIEILEKSKKSELNDKQLMKVYKNINEDVDDNYKKDIKNQLDEYYEKNMNWFSNLQQKKTSSKN